MATIKLYAESRKPRKDGTTKVYLHLTHDRKKKTIPINIYVSVSHFDFESCKCFKSHPNSAKVNFKLFESLAKAQEILLDLSGKRIDIDELALKIESVLFTGPSPELVRPFVDKLIQEQIATGRNGNAASYSNALNQFDSWLGRETKWTDFTYDKLNSFKIFKISNGIKPNSVGAYFRAYRAWINEAIRRGLFPKDDYPFQRGLIPAKHRSRRRNVSKDIMKQIWERRTSFSGYQRIAINTILLQFLLQGADFIDVARLTIKDIQNGYIVFCRYKNRAKGNNQEVRVKITPEIQQIIDERTNDFLVPIVSIKNIEKEYTNFNTKRRKFRRVMKEALESMNINELTSKGIRHTWATIAASLGVTEEIRELAMGHSSGGMQEIYTEIDQREVDQANFKVITSLLEESPN